MTPAVLVVDDSLTIRMDLEAVFTAAGFAPVGAATVAGARAALAAGEFALAVLDVLLPDGDGIELLQEMKADPRTAALPVMLLTSEAEVRDRLRGLRTGADDYVGKPYDSAFIVGRALQLTRPLQAAGTDAPPVLVIDDSLSVRQSLAEELAAAGYRPLTAASGEEGLRLALAARPLALIVDGSLPGGMDGATVIRRVKQDVSLRHIPCLLLTASEQREDELRALEAGADAYVRKHGDAAVLLARLQAALRRGSAPASRPDSASSLLSPKRILAVDDSPTYLNQLADALRADGYDMVLARSGEEALELLPVQPVDCILLDVRMPGLDGHETCRRVKAVPAWKEIPLLMLTSLDERAAMVEGINAGADDYIPKSGDFEVLRARLRAQLRRKQYEDENRRVHEELVAKDLEAARAKAAQEVAEARALMAEELERKNRELEAFSYSVSHDLRAPLRRIQGFAQLLQEDAASLPEGPRGNLEHILAGAERMSQLIEDLLALSRLSRAELHRRPVNLAAVAREIVADLARHEPQREVMLDAPQVLEASADARLMRAALENLVGNAWKFTSRRGAARIELGAVEGAAPAVYYVRDNGAGFDPAHAGKLFGPFQRLHRQNEFPGTGIGLATVYRIMDRHGGRIWAESEVDRGATFYFTCESASRPAALAPSSQGR